MNNQEKIKQLEAENHLLRKHARNLCGAIADLRVGDEDLQRESVEAAIEEREIVLERIDSLPLTDAAAKRIEALEAVAEAARAFSYEPKPSEKSGYSLWLDYVEGKDLVDALQKLELANKKCGK